MAGTDSRRRLTKTLVEGLAPGAVVWDADVPGFGARRLARLPSYVLKYRAGRRQRWVTIGAHGAPWTVETARKEARRLLGVVATGADPAEKRDADRHALNVAERRGFRPAGRPSSSRCRPRLQRSL